MQSDQNIADGRANGQGLWQGEGGQALIGQLECDSRSGRILGYAQALLRAGEQESDFGGFPGALTLPESILNVGQIFFDRRETSPQCLGGVLCFSLGFGDLLACLFLLGGQLVIQLRKLALSVLQRLTQRNLIAVLGCYQAIHAVGIGLEQFPAVPGDAGQ